jgi:hypothetical protein
LVTTTPAGALVTPSETTQSSSAALFVLRAAGADPDTVGKWRQQMSGSNRNYVENLIHAVCWVDDHGDPVDEVPDRFQALYLIENEQMGNTIIENWPLARKGVSSMSIRDMATLGFSTQEYLALIRYEDEFGETIQSEEELDALIGSSPTRAPY